MTSNDIDASTVQEVLNNLVSKHLHAVIGISVEETAFLEKRVPRGRGGTLTLDILLLFQLVVNW